ncbi:hypothetical protein K438DRAFT_1974332 [Mycena galopus ATCC 62051]|nr:hypothetical protein K438DRAFT_1974332 [Mycena galopus ATCC 62051]
MYRKSLDPEVATWDEIVKAATGAEVLMKLVQKHQKEPELEYQSDESEYYEDDEADAPVDSGSKAEDDFIEESPARTSCIVTISCARGSVSTAEGEVTVFETVRLRNHRDALDQTTEILHVGSVRFDPPFEVEEGGVEPIVSFEEFCTDSDKIVDSEIQIGAETDDPQVEAMTLRLTSSNSQKIGIEPVPRYNADVSAEDRGDAPPPVDPVDPFDPLISSTDATRQSAERLRYAETCWVGREVEKKKEKLVEDAKEVEVGTKKTKGAYAAATAAITAAAATQKAEPPSVDFGSIPNAPSSSTTPITTIAHLEKDDVLDNIDEIYMGNI